MVNSTSLSSGRPGNSSGNTSGNSHTIGILARRVVWIAQVVLARSILRGKTSLLNFDPVSMPEKCCNRPEIVAITEIATLFSLEGVADACVGKALDNTFLGSVAKCVLDLQHPGVAT
jgi:hypothetical protein